MEPMFTILGPPVRAPVLRETPQAGVGQSRSVPMASESVFSTQIRSGDVTRGVPSCQADPLILKIDLPVPVIQSSVIHEETFVLRSTSLPASRHEALSASCSLRTAEPISSWWWYADIAQRLTAVAAPCIDPYSVRSTGGHFIDDRFHTPWDRYWSALSRRPRWICASGVTAHTVGIELRAGPGAAAISGWIALSWPEMHAGDLFHEASRAVRCPSLTELETTAG